MTGDSIERRVAAAIAYSRQPAREISRRMGGSPSASRILHWKRGNEFPRANRHTLLDALARACELPTPFFYADFGRLHEIVETGAYGFTQTAERGALPQLARDERRRGRDRRSGDRRQATGEQQ